MNRSLSIREGQDAAFLVLDVSRLPVHHLRKKERKKGGNERDVYGTGRFERSQGGSLTMASKMPPVLNGFLVTSNVRQSTIRSVTPYWVADRWIPGVSESANGQEPATGRAEGRLRRRTFAPDLTTVYVAPKNEGSKVRCRLRIKGEATRCVKSMGGCSRKACCRYRQRGHKSTCQAQPERVNRFQSEAQRLAHQGLIRHQQGHLRIHRRVSVVGPRRRLRDGPCTQTTGTDVLIPLLHVKLVD